MTLDELLLEWSYRSERGYPSVDNPSDISTLKQILKELNIPSDPIIESLTNDMLDELEDDPQDLGIPGDDGLEDSPVQQAKEKQFQKSAEKDLDQAIDDELDAENLEACEMGRKEVMRIYDKLAAKGVFSTPQAVNKFINKACSFETYEPLKKHLSDKGFGLTVYKRYTSELQSLTDDVPEKDRDIFLDYIKNPNKQINFPSNKRGNLKTEMEKSGVPNSIIQKLITHTTQDEGKRGVGMGELSLAIIFKNITDNILPGGGDLNLNGEKFEIKGEMATLGDKPEAHKASIETVKKFEEFGIKRDKKLFFKGEQYSLGQLPLVLSLAYKSTPEKEKLKNLVKEMLIEDGNLSSESVEYVFPDIDFTNEQSIQTNIAGAHFYNYAANPKYGFTHFLAHDHGEKSLPATRTRPKSKIVVGDGNYIYVSGTPGEMTDQLKEQGAKFQKVAFNNMRPRIGFGSTMVEEIS